MAFTHTTFGQLKTQLALKLSDPANVYWTDAELGLYIKEALQTWSLLTSYWRDFGILPVQIGESFYELSAIENKDGELLLSRTTTDQAVVTIMQYHLLEPATGSSWTGSSQFTLDDLTQALQRRRDQFLEETGVVLTEHSQYAGAGTTKMVVPDTTLDIRRVAWTGDVTQTTWPLYPDDLGRQQLFNLDDSSTQGTPATYSSIATEELTYWIIPPPNEPGTLDLLVLQSGAALDPTSGVALGVPEDMAWVIKWGALSDLLGKDGPARDLGRSYFCERRFRLGVEIARQRGVILDVNLNNIPLSGDSLRNLDTFQPNWQSTDGPVDSASPVANFLVVAPRPDEDFSITLSVARNAILPEDDGDYLQIGREHLGVVLDYAEHLASFKMGGMEFRTTFKNADNFFLAAIRYNDRMAANNPNAVAILQQSLKDWQDRPLYAPSNVDLVRTLQDNAGQLQ